jgi:WD40-like Beta Propeller Repeat
MSWLAWWRCSSACHSYLQRRKTAFMRCTRPLRCWQGQVCWDSATVPRGSSTAYGLTMRPLGRLVRGALSASLLASIAVAPVAAADGQVLASTRGQVAWLDLSAPRPRPITTLQLPSYPADITAIAGSALAVASIESPFNGTGPIGTDLVTVDLQSGALHPLISRQSSDEMLDAPVLMPDGASVVFQHTVHGAAPAIRVEQVGLDGSPTGLVIGDARFPAPSADSFAVAFVRYVDQHAELIAHSLVDNSETPILEDARFIALSYPRYSPDGQTIAFAAISLIGSAGESPGRQSTRHSVGSLAGARGRLRPAPGSRRAERRPIDRLVARWVAAPCLRWLGQLPGGRSQRRFQPAFVPARLRRAGVVERLRAITPRRRACPCALAHSAQLRRDSASGVCSGCCSGDS